MLHAEVCFDKVDGVTQIATAEGLVHKVGRRLLLRLPRPRESTQASFRQWVAPRRWINHLSCNQSIPEWLRLSRLSFALRMHQQNLVRSPGGCIPSVYVPDVQACRRGVAWASMIIMHKASRTLLFSAVKSNHSFLHWLPVFVFRSMHINERANGRPAHFGSSASWGEHQTADEYF